MSILDIFLVEFDFLDDVVIHGVETPLECNVSQVGEVTRNGHQQSCNPIDWSRSQSLYQDFICIPRNNGGHFPIDEQEQVPSTHAAPYQKVLYPCEVTHCQCNLAVYCPDDAREHCCTHCRHVCCLSATTKCLVVEYYDIQEEYDE